MDSARRIVALLPLKKMSERIPGKNFRTFQRKPLFRWVLDTLLDVEEVDCVVINTDAVEELRMHGVLPSPRLVVRQRKPELIGNFVSMNEIIRDDVLNVPSHIYLMTHATNPLLSKATIKDAIAEFKQSLEKNDNDSLFSVNKLQGRFYSKNGIQLNHDLKSLLPTQHLEYWFEENSNLYLFTSSSFKESGSRIGMKPLLYETPRLESVDIDEPTDWQMAEALFEHLEKRKGGL